jgi:hypothetical protein
MDTRIRSTPDAYIVLRSLPMSADLPLHVPQTDDVGGFRFEIRIVAGPGNEAPVLPALAGGSRLVRECHI